MKTYDEKEIITLIAQGYSIQEIAEKIGVSFDTAKSRIQKTRIQYRAKNSPHLVAIAYDKGIVSNTTIIEENKIDATTARCARLKATAWTNQNRIVDITLINGAMVIAQITQIRPLGIVVKTAGTFNETTGIRQFKWIDINAIRRHEPGRRGT